jgi:hypothetical protein
MSRDGPPPDAGGRGESFLARFARLKREAARGRPDASAPSAAAPPPAAPAPPAGLPPETVARGDDAAGALPEAGDAVPLPPIESLTAASDIAAFLREGVPLALRNAALRRIWALDPAIRDFIGPADYAWDWNLPDGVPGFAADLGGADLPRLLAQAIGAADDPPPAPAGAVPERAVAAMSPAPAAAADEAAEPGAAAGRDALGAVAAVAAPPVRAPTLDVADGLLHRSPVALPPVAAEAARAGADNGREPTQQPATPRRHGGALPV